MKVGQRGREVVQRLIKFNTSDAKVGLRGRKVVQWLLKIIFMEEGKVGERRWELLDVENGGFFANREVGDVGGKFSNTRQVNSVRGKNKYK